MAKALFRNIRSGRRQAGIVNLKSLTRKKLEETLDKKVKPALVKSHEKIVANWEHKVGFEAKKVIKPDSITVYVYPTGPNKHIWVFVDQGTKPHVIKPKKASRLAFQTGYTAKTLAKPARTVSGGGKASGGVVFAKQVNHPGSEGREFSRQIAEDIAPEFKKEVENAFRQLADEINGE